MKPRLLVEKAVVAGAVPVLPLPACPTSSRPAPWRGSSAAAMPSATTASAPASVTMAGALAHLHPLTGPFLAPGSKPGILSAPVIVADQDNNRLVISTRRVGRYGSSPDRGISHRPDLPTS